VPKGKRNKFNFRKDTSDRRRERREDMANKKTTISSSQLNIEAMINEAIAKAISEALSNGIVATDNDSKGSKAKKSELPTLKDLMEDFEVVADGKKYVVCGAKYEDGKNKGERHILSKGRLNGLEALCDGKKTVMHRPQKIGKGKSAKWIPFYITCDSKKLADALIKDSCEATLEALKSKKSEAEVLIPEFLK